MKTNHFLPILVLVNIIALFFMAASPQRENFEKISVKEFELIDTSGKQRASIKVENDGEVVFRLKDAAGTIRVKLGAGKNGSGLVLLDEDTNPGIQMLAKKRGSAITVLGEEGRKREY